MSNSQKEPTKSVGHRIIAILERLNLDATPINYEFFYEIITGNNPELRERFNKLGKQFARSDLDELAREFLPHHFGASIFDTSSKLMRNDLNDLRQSLQISRSDLEAYTTRLSRSSERINGLATVDDGVIKDELSSIVEITDRQQAKSSSVLGTIEAKIASVNSLSREIDEVERIKFTHPATGLANRRAFFKFMAQLYEGKRFPEDHALVLVHIANLEKLDHADLQAIRKSLLRRLGDTITSLTGEGDMAAWTDKPHLSLVISSVGDAELKRIAAIISGKFEAAIGELLRALPHAQTMPLRFGVAATFTANSSGGLISNAEKALSVAVHTNSASPVIFGQSNTSGQGANYYLYDRSNGLTPGFRTLG